MPSHLAEGVHPLVKWLPDWCDLKPDGTFYRLSDLAMTNPIALKMAHPAELAQFVPLAFGVGGLCLRTLFFHKEEWTVPWIY